MKSKVFMNFFVLFSSVFMLAGCSLLSPAVKNVNYYDLTYSGRERYKVNCRFELRNFHNMSPAKLNLLYTGKNSVIQLDQYNYWVQSPEVMLRRFMLNAVEPAADEKAKILDASLTVFDFKFDIVAKESVLGIHLILKDRERETKFEKNYVVRTAVEQSDRNAYVAAMNKCAEQFIIQAVNDIKKF